MTIHIIITMVLLLAFLIGSIWYAKKKYQINLSVLGLGAVAFFVSSQILEKLVHILVLHPQKDGSIALLQDHPLVYIIYGLAMAAFFEETARLIFFKWLEKKRSLEKADALAYGLHAFFDLAPSLAQVGWLTNPVLVEVVLAVELILVAYGTKAIFCKKS